MKRSDVVPEAGCHHLFETLTAIYFQMAGSVPVTQRKCHSFPVITMYFQSRDAGGRSKVLLERMQLKVGYC